MKELDTIATNIERNEEVLKKCFACLVKNGLEKTTMRTLCEATKMSASSLYYRFESKDKIVLCASFYGLEIITKEVFYAVAQKVVDFEGMFRVLVENVEKRKRQIRLIYQVATSPHYGERFSDNTKALASVYNNATEMVAKQLSCPSEKLRPCVDFAMSTIRDYLLWNDKERAKRQMFNIYKEALRISNDYNNSEGYTNGEV